MGWVEPRITKAGKQRFAAKYRDLKGNKRGAGTYATEQKAINAWHQAEAKIALGKIEDPRCGKQKFCQYVLD